MSKALCLATAVLCLIAPACNGLPIERTGEPTLSPVPSAAVAMPASATLAPTTPTVRSTPVRTNTVVTDTLVGSQIQFETLPTTTEIDLPLPGSLLLEADNPYLLNLESGATRNLAPPGYCLAVSPNRQLFSYCVTSEQSPTVKSLVIESSVGQQQAIMPVRPEWWWDFAVSWLDNERLTLNILEPTSTDLTILPIAIVDPFGGTEELLVSDYPGITGSPIGPGGSIPFVYSTVVYDPSLALVVYPRSSTTGDYIVLWDRKAQRQLAELEELGVFLHRPVWSVNGAFFIVAVSVAGVETADNKQMEELFVVSRDGAIKQATRFENDLNNARIGNAAISPDASRIAFWLDAAPSPCAGPNLALLDLTAERVLDFCVLGSDDLGAAPLPPVWSPDGRYIAIDSYHDDQSHLRIVDTEENRLIDYPDAATPQGWLVGAMP
jgi:hypothetical protein